MIHTSLHRRITRENLSTPHRPTFFSLTGQSFILNYILFFFTGVNGFMKYQEIKRVGLNLAVIFGDPVLVSLPATQFLKFNSWAVSGLQSKFWFLSSPYEVLVPLLLHSPTPAITNCFEKQTRHVHSKIPPPRITSLSPSLGKQLPRYIPLLGHLKLVMPILMSPWMLSFLNYSLRQLLKIAHFENQRKKQSQRFILTAGKKHWGCQEDWSKKAKSRALFSVQPPSQL